MAQFVNRVSSELFRSEIIPAYCAAIRSGFTDAIVCAHGLFPLPTCSASPTASIALRAKALDRAQELIPCGNLLGRQGNVRDKLHWYGDVGRENRLEGRSFGQLERRRHLRRVFPNPRDAPQMFGELIVALAAKLFEPIHNLSHGPCR